MEPRGQYGQTWKKTAEENTANDKRESLPKGTQINIRKDTNVCIVFF